MRHEVALRWLSVVVFGNLRVLGVHPALDFVGWADACNGHNDARVLFLNFHVAPRGPPNIYDCMLNIADSEGVDAVAPMNAKVLCHGHLGHCRLNVESP